MLTIAPCPSCRLLVLFVPGAAGKDVPFDAKEVVIERADPNQRWVPAPGEAPAFPFIHTGTLKGERGHLPHQCPGMELFTKEAK